MRPRFRGRLALWGLLFGAVGGLLDTWFLMSLGIDLRVAGRDMTLPVALYLATSFAGLCGAIGWFVDARARSRRDARTIRDQLRVLEATQEAALRNEKLAAIGRLAAGVAHEVRNPLGVIRASASMVQESFDPGSEPHRACDFICEEIDRLNGLITSLLTFARPAEPRLAPIHPEKLIDRALSVSAGELERRRIEVLRQADPGLPEFVADPDLLVQLLLDLVTNAAEALGQGGRIEVRLQGSPEFVCFEVADDGPGVPRDATEKVFEPFYTTKATGTGLGLAMTARIAQSHGGGIRVVEGAGAGPGGEGACFRIELPVAGPGGQEPTT
jgi:two-component system sensor histidine kinase HydH